MREVAERRTSKGGCVWSPGSTASRTASTRCASCSTASRGFAPSATTSGWPASGRQAFAKAARWGVLAAAPRLRLTAVAGWWVERFQRKVASGERRERTLEIHRYYLDRHLLPLLGSRLIREITVGDVAELLDGLRAKRRAERQSPVRSRRSTTSCASRCATAGSARTRSRSSRPTSARAHPWGSAPSRGRWPAQRSDRAGRRPYPP
jgi:hypothetical protein